MADLRFSLAERKPGSINTTGSSGNQVSITNKDDFEDAVRSVHTTQHRTNWFVVGYDGNSTDKIKLLSTGTGGLSELVNNHFDDSSIEYAILRITDVVDNIPTDRFLYITWMGDNVSGILKARCGANKSEITRLLGHYNVEIIASSKSELSESEVMNKIQDASGSRNRSGDNVKSTTVAASTTTPSTPSNITKTSGTTSGSKGPTANTKSIGLTFNNESEIRSIIQKVKSPQDPTNWVLIGYENKEQLGLVGSGTGGLSEFTSKLIDTNVNYGLVATYDVIDNIKQIKLAKVTFVGPNVSPMVKGRLTTHAGTIDAFFSPYHVSLFSENPSSDLTDQILETKVQQLKGMK